MTNFNPLEQFSVYSVISVINSTQNNNLMIITITNTVVLFLLGLFVFTTFQIATSSHSIKPTKWNLVVESWIASILGILKDQMGSDPKSYAADLNQGLRPGNFFPLIFTLFSFIFISNILGMIPYSFTTTSHISVTLGFSISIMIGITLIGFNLHKLDFFTLFLPKGTPLPLVPLLVLIDFISYTARAFSLALRLTANVSAGHCLFGVISMLALSAAMSLTNILLSGITITLPLVVLVPLYGLELLVALLQAYVFTLLTCSYTADIINMGH